MTSVEVVVTRNDFPRIVRKLDQGVEDALDNAVVSTIEVVDPLTRRDTGDLIGNKTVEVGAEHREVHWNQDYAAYQNSGTYKMSGTHFADKGADAGLETLLNELKGIF